jgi:hypothetical protein
MKRDNEIVNSAWNKIRDKWRALNFWRLMASRQWVARSTEIPTEGLKTIENTIALKADICEYHDR